MTSANRDSSELCPDCQVALRVCPSFCADFWVVPSYRGKQTSWTVVELALGFHQQCTPGWCCVPALLDIVSVCVHVCVSVWAFMCPRVCAAYIWMYLCNFACVCMYVCLVCLCACVCVSLCAYIYYFTFMRWVLSSWVSAPLVCLTQRSEENIRPLGTGVVDGCELLFWEPNSLRVLQEQPVFSTPLSTVSVTPNIILKTACGGQGRCWIPSTRSCKQLWAARHGCWEPNSGPLWPSKHSETLSRLSSLPLVLLLQ